MDESVGWAENPLNEIVAIKALTSNLIKAFATDMEFSVINSVFIEGYNLINKTSIHQLECNPYFNLLKLWRGEFDHRDDLTFLNDEELHQLCIKKFNMVRSMKNEGFDPSRPIWLIKTSNKNKLFFDEWGFSLVDGYHRLAAAQLHDIEYVYIRKIDLYDMSIPSDIRDLIKCSSKGESFVLSLKFEPLIQEGKRYLVFGLSSPISILSITRRYIGSRFVLVGDKSFVETGQNIIIRSFPHLRNINYALNAQVTLPQDNWIVYKHNE